MFKRLYSRNQYFLNLLAVLSLIEVIRVFDWLAWTPATPGKTTVILLNHLSE